MGKKRRHEENNSESESGSEDDSSGSEASSGDEADSDESSNRKHHKKHKKHHHHYKHHHKDKEKEKEKDKPLEKNEEEALEKLKNREATKKRSRMWQTVGDSDDSDSDDDDESGASSGDDDDKRGNGEASRDGGKRSASRERKKKDKKKDKHRESKDRKKKKEKKHKKEHKKEKKHKKHKMSKVADSMMGAVDMNRYGKYGIIREADFSRKKHDFEVWLQETQSIPDIPRQKFEAMKLFRKYMEDYNTATFPHKKYYDVEKYEMDEYKRKQEKEAFRQLRKEGKFNDEQEHAAERRKSQTQKDREDFEWAMKMLNKDKIDAIKEQEHLKAKMQLAYKSGDMSTVKKIEYMLLPEEERQKMKRNTPADHLNL